MTDQPKIIICMGSQSDWPTMSAAKDILDQLDVACDVRIISAHRTPDRLTSFAKSAADNGVQVIIRGRGRGGSSAGHDRRLTPACLSWVFRLNQKP